MGISTGVGLAIAGGASLLGAKMSKDAAKDAAAMQMAGGDMALAQQFRMFEMGREDLAPYRKTGYRALKDIERMKPFLTAQFGPKQFETYLDPSMAFRQKLGTQATERMANVGGGALSGNTMRALNEFGQNLASTEFGNAFNRFQTERGNIYNTLANIAGMGQQAVNTGVQAGQAYGNQAAGIITGQAAAGAAGQVGAANAYAGALGNIGNMAALYGMMKPQSVQIPGNVPGAAITPGINMNMA
jgi:hypothetical protein